MLITIPTRRRPCLWNPADGSLTRLSELEAAILAEVKTPTAPACPTSVRYAVAKYDSAEVDEAYADLRALFAAAEGEVAAPKLVIEAGTSPALTEVALRAAGEAFPAAALALEADDAVRAQAVAMGVQLA